MCKNLVSLKYQKKYTIIINISKEIYNDNKYF